ncbi:ABC transporter permease subunit [Thermococcus sp. M39]|uniref:ABC transporter permease subunit n=1 Tax=unclassified Thermococcus TaxID=2627626 RepID=UPI001439A8AD|nr:MULTISPECIES: ABC transporter permease subunit [unclassified Thermococcus]NJE08197.1 ABC transporter permease subunit [Thermococcus sp. M39]NJE11690.1 ABC transporter permease subunit [Thermococcus sp. LS2]
MRIELPKRKGEIVKAFVVTLLAIFIMFIILFPVYYIFTVSIKPVSTLATTELTLIPRNITAEAYKEVLFGFEGSKISANFTGSIEGLGRLDGDTLYVTNGKITGVVKAGPFTALRFEIPFKEVRFKVDQSGSKEGQFTGEISGAFRLTRINKDNTIGFAVVKDVKLKKGELDGITMSGAMEKYIVARNIGSVEVTAVGKFVNSVFFAHLKNSLFIAGLTVILTLFFVIPAAYAFSRLRFFGREHILYFYLMFTQVAGGLGIAGLIALYGMIVKLGLYDKLPVLSLIYAAGSVPFNTWLLKGYIDSISPDFDEAALVDGAGYLQIIRYVLLPMALPGIATVAIFAFIGGWTEFILANLLLTEVNQPLSVWIYLLMGGIGRGIDWNYFAAAALLFALPVFIMFMLAQNYVRSGLTVGGLKE